MAQITISDEQYASLTSLAQERGVTLDALISTLIDQLETLDQQLFWGANDALDEALDEIKHRPPQFQSDDVFLRQLEGRKHSTGAPHADA